MLKRIIPILLALILLSACSPAQSEPTSAPTIEVPTALPTETSHGDYCSNGSSRTNRNPSRNGDNCSDCFWSR